MRTLATRGTRRSLLTALAGGIFGTLAGDLRSSNAKKRKKHKKHRGGGGGGQCLQDGELLPDGCQPGAEARCCSGVCSAESNACGTCLPDGTKLLGRCTGDDVFRCCSGVCSKESGMCGACVSNGERLPHTCAAGGEFTDECCAGFCIFGDFCGCIPDGLPHGNVCREGQLGDCCSNHCTGELCGG